MRTGTPLLWAVVAALLVGCSASAVTTSTVTTAPTTASTAPASTIEQPEIEEPAPTFEASIGAVDAETLGSSWREGCPIGPEELSLLTITHWDFDGEVRSGELVVHSDVAEDVVSVLASLFDARFPLERVELVQAYNSDDDLSMAANNTSAFNCRRVAGTVSWSEHAFGKAIDINPVQNPFLRSAVLPSAGAEYLDRSDLRPGMIVPGDVVVQAFAAIDWRWGGEWTSPDYQHFSQSGR